MKHQLKLFASKVREVIESINSTEFSSDCQLFHSFPRGACGDTSMILGRILLDKFDIDCDYVCGSCLIEGREQETHAWLEYKGFKIDITADQFDGIEDKVIVEEFHELYEFYEPDVPRKISTSFYDELTSDYNMIIHRIYTE